MLEVAESRQLRRYGATKWASEVQLQQLHERYGVPVSIFRCGMILAHSRRVPCTSCCAHASACHFWRPLCVCMLHHRRAQALQVQTTMPVAVKKVYLMAMSL